MKLLPSKRFIDLVIAGVLFAATLALLLATTNIGFTRDEGFYFHAASLYVGWFEELWANFWAGDLATSFTQANIDQHWSYNPEHPVLMKASFALSHKFFHDILGVMSPSTAWRFPAMITAAALVSGVYLFARDLGGRLAGFIAAGALLFQPRFFFHAHLAVFDVPITAFWFWVVYAYWKSYESRGWALAAGLLFGLALSVKLNAFFLPIVLVGHWALTRWRDLRFERGGDTPTITLPPIPRAFWAMLVLGPLLFYALWPRHWFETFSRIKWYMDFHLGHEHYMVYYFGQNLQIPPFPVSYPWVMTLVTVPMTILLAFAIGAVVYFVNSGQVVRWREIFRSLRNKQWPGRDESADPKGTGFLLTINIIFPILLISMPDTPIFGGTKHWMPAMPFLAIVAGLGVAAIYEGLRRDLRSVFGRLELIAAPAMALILAAAVIGPAVYATAHNHPHGTSYYNELMGSHRGAADAQMFRQFWGYSSRHALPWLNEHAEEDARVWHHNTIGMAWRAYQQEGLARPDLRASSLRASDYALYHHQKAFMFQQLPVWEEYGTMAPSYVVDIDGVPLLSVYERQDPMDFKYPEVWR